MGFKLKSCKEQLKMEHICCVRFGSHSQCSRDHFIPFLMHIIIRSCIRSLNEFRLGVFQGNKGRFSKLLHKISFFVCLFPVKTDQLDLFNTGPKQKPKLTQGKVNCITNPMLETHSSKASSLSASPPDHFYGQI